MESSNIILGFVLGLVAAGVLHYIIETTGHRDGEQVRHMCQMLEQKEGK